MKFTAIITLATLAAATAFANPTTNGKSPDWIERMGLDREKATRLLVDYVVETKAIKESMTREGRARKFLEIVRNNLDDLKTPTRAVEVDATASNDCVCVIKESDGKRITIAGIYSWNGSNAAHRVFTSATGPGRFVFGKDYDMATSRFYVEKDGIDVFKPEWENVGKCWRYRSVTHPNRWFFAKRMRTNPTREHTTISK